MIRLQTVISALLLGLFGWACSSGCGADAPAADAPAAGKKILTDWFETVQAAKSLSADMEAEVAVKQLGNTVESDQTVYRFAFARPQQFALVIAKGVGIAVVNNDKHLYQFNAEVNRYQLSDAPRATAAEALQSKVLKEANFGQGLGLVGDALQAENAEKFLAKYASIAFVGEEDLAGAKARHVRIVNDVMPIDLWFTADSKQLLRASPDLKAGLAAKGSILKPGIDLTLVIDFKNWKYDAALPPEIFAISPPTGAELVDDIFAQPPHMLLGKQAPAFETMTLDGKPLKLSDLAGKVVLLDFWATWCAPCVAALPKISETAAKFKDRGVVFYAVNQQEEPSIIKEFLAAQKLNVPVALDLERNLGLAYGADVLPQTVIVDKQGKVQVVHLGAGEDIGEQLTKDLEAVLAGKDLAAEKTEKK